MTNRNLIALGRSPKNLKGKLVAWSKVKPLANLKLGKKSQAALYLDKEGTPKLFVLETAAFLDILSAIDEALLDKLTDEEYHSPKTNPAGWLIDNIESKIPLDQKFVNSLKRAIEEANRKGWVPFSKILSEIASA